MSNRINGPVPDDPHPYCGPGFMIVSRTSEPKGESAPESMMVSERIFTDDDCAKWADFFENEDWSGN